MPRERLERCEGFGIATPSHMDRNGTIRLAPLLGWRDVPLADLVRARLPVQAPVLAENDANALAIGATYGLGDAHSGVTLFLVMESGVGGGIVIDGRLFRGANGLAGEIGHLQMQPGGDAPRTLEQLIGLEPLLSEYGRICGHGHPSLAGLLAAVRAGEPMALGIAQSWARFLAHALIQACRIIDADRIVLGGSVAALYPHVAEHVAEHFRTMQEPGFPIPSIALHENSAVGSAYGAACMLHQRYLSLDSHRFVEDEGAGRAGVSDHE
jgi:predicted NBD/HSP70 family sugar kinase